MFHFKKAKRAFYFEEIQKTAQKGLDEYGVSDEMLMNFANTSIHIENRLGISAWGTYANGNKMINDLKQMISDKKMKPPSDVLSIHRRQHTVSAFIWKTYLLRP